MSAYTELPPNLPCPHDDGAATHLDGLELPDLNLESTQGPRNLREITTPRTVLFIFPRAGSTLEPNTNQELWDSIPGARGCTPQSCGYRDLAAEFRNLDTDIYGLSIQSPRILTEITERNHLPFPLLSDQRLELAKALKLPTFEFEGERLIKRMALVCENGAIRKVFYPVFPPNLNASVVLGWLKTT
jgi:peroxiredoxin